MPSASSPSPSSEVLSDEQYYRLYVEAAESSRRLMEIALLLGDANAGNLAQTLYRMHESSVASYFDYNMRALRGGGAEAGA